MDWSGILERAGIPEPPGQKEAVVAWEAEKETKRKERVAIKEAKEAKEQERLRRSTYRRRKF
jgi:hypothetical protein